MNIIIYYINYYYLLTDKGEMIKLCKFNNEVD